MVEITRASLRPGVVLVNVPLPTHGLPVKKHRQGFLRVAFDWFLRHKAEKPVQHRPTLFVYALGTPADRLSDEEFCDFQGVMAKLAESAVPISEDSRFIVAPSDWY